MKKYVLNVLIIGILLLATVLVTGCTDSRTQCCETCSKLYLKTSVLCTHIDQSGRYRNHFIDSDGVDYGVDTAFNEWSAYNGHNVTFTYKCDGERYVFDNIIKDNTCYNVVNNCGCQIQSCGCTKSGDATICVAKCQC